MRALVAAATLVAGLAVAVAAPRDPFLKPPAPGPRILRLLTPPDFVDRAVVETLETATGAPISLDTYANEADLAERLSELRYDVVVLSGPELARRIERMSRLDRHRLPNAARVQPLVAAKYAAYDRDGAFGVPYGWTAFGLLYDSDKLPVAPVSWAQALSASKDAQRFGACGVVWPDAREQSFLAAFRMMGVDAARANGPQVKSAAALIDRARGTFVAFAAPDEVGALAKGAGCLGAGTAGEAAAVATRGPDTPNIRFAYPREGAPLTLYAYAIPLNAASPTAAYALLDALLAPDNARRDAASAGVNGAQDDADLAELRRLAPEPLLAPAVAAAMGAEWKRLTSAK